MRARLCAFVWPFRLLHPFEHKQQQQQQQSVKVQHGVQTLRRNAVLLFGP